MIGYLWNAVFGLTIVVGLISSGLQDQYLINVGLTAIVGYWLGKIGA